ncbi:enolase C-terminal domain-like protein [Mesorhizobium sp. ORM8.1]
MRRSSGDRGGESIRTYDLLWFEEPIIPDDYQGYAKIAEATGMPLAMGENLHLNEEFEQASAWSKLSYVQPDASNCGGITGWLRGGRSCTHGRHSRVQSRHAGTPCQLGRGQSTAGWVEAHGFDIDLYTTRPLKLQDGAGDRPRRAGRGCHLRLAQTGWL